MQRVQIQAGTGRPRQGRRITIAAIAALLAVTAFGPGASAAAPSNDARADATVIGQLPFTDDVDTSDATADPGDPGCDGADHSVWWSHTPARSSRVIIMVEAEFDANLAIWTDDGGGLEQIWCSDGPWADLRLVAGQTYLVTVSSWEGSDGGPITLRMKRPAPITLQIGGFRAQTLGRTGDLALHGFVRCSGGTFNGFDFLVIRQRQADGIMAQGSAFRAPRIRCDGRRHEFRALILGDAAFHAGPARLLYSAQVCGDQCLRRTAVPLIRIVAR